MIVEPDFLTHWKTRMLVNELGLLSAPLCLIALWSHCQLRRTDRFKISDAALKSICVFDGDAAKLAVALLACGWIERQDEEIIVHGWAERNSKLIGNWTNGKTGGRPKGKPNDNPTGTQLEPNKNPTGTQLEPNDNPRGTHEEPMRGDERREDKKDPPYPPELDNPEFRSAWLDYVQFRKEQKAKKLGPTGVKTKFKQLAELGSEEAIKAIRRSIGNGWTGIFPEQNGKADKKPEEPIQQRAIETTPYERDHGDYIGTGAVGRFEKDTRLCARPNCVPCAEKRAKGLTR